MICRHGNLRRQCETCDLADEVARLREWRDTHIVSQNEAIDLLRAENRTLRNIGVIQAERIEVLEQRLERLSSGD